MRRREDNEILSQAILEKLLAFSDEEIDALNGKVNIDRSIYLDDEETIDARKILDEGVLIGVINIIILS